MGRRHGARRGTAAGSVADTVRRSLKGCRRAAARAPGVSGPTGSTSAVPRASARRLAAGRAARHPMTYRDRLGAVAAVVVAAPVLIGATYSMLAAVGLVGVGARGFTLERVVSVLTSPQTWA